MAIIPACLIAAPAICHSMQQRNREESMAKKSATIIEEERNTLKQVDITQEIVDTVCNSLRASKQSLVRQLAKANEERKSTEIIAHQLGDVERALEIFQHLES